MILKDYNDTQGDLRLSKYQQFQLTQEQRQHKFGESRDTYFSEEPTWFPDVLIFSVFRFVGRDF